MIANKSKGKAKLSEEQKREKIREAMLKKKSFEERTLKLVEQLMETGLSDQFLIESANILNQSFYTDAVEERSLTGYCGYPLCDKIKPSFKGKGRYHISLKNKKVYDIEVRKLYCSNQCFKASNFFKDQLDTSPLWLRETESMKNITLLEANNNKSSVLRGEELDFGFIQSSNVIETPSENAQEELEDSTCPLPDNNELETQSLNIPQQKPFHHQNPQRQHTEDVGASAWEVASETITNWFTIDSFRVVFGDEVLKARLRENNVSEETWATSVGDSGLDDQYQARYRELCRKLDLMELLEEDKETEDDCRLPLPSMDMLRKHCQEENSKMEAFLAGQQSYRRNLVSNIVENDVEGVDPRIPLLDHKAQQQLRRRLVFDGLLRTLPEILKLLKLTQDEILDDLKALVNSFKFAADNVVFKSDEWTLIAFIVLKLLSAKNETIGRSLNSEDQKKYLTLVLMSFQTDLTHIDVLIRDITADIRQLVAKY